jgi:high-affinity Fe2+/Pb2+ permease
VSALIVIAVIGAVLAVLSRSKKLTRTTGAIVVVAGVAIALVLRFLTCRGGANKEKAE